jgi:hypothetical protein
MNVLYSADAPTSSQKGPIQRNVNKEQAPFWGTIAMSTMLLELALCILFVSGCSLDSVQSEPMSPSALNANAARYHGQTVMVRGYVTLAAEGHTLYESQALNAEFEKGWDSGSRDFDVRKYDKYCLTIANPDLLYKHRAMVNRKTLIVQGKFIKDYLDGHTIDLGACPLPTAIIIDESDFKRRYGSLLLAK